MEKSDCNQKLDVSSISPLALAFVGDAVFSLRVREILVTKFDVNANLLTKKSAAIVNAGNQYLLYRKIEPMLEPDEQDICKRARNANIHSHAKNYSVTEYIYATALEALIGYLHLSGKKERLKEILTICLEDIC